MTLAPEQLALAEKLSPIFFPYLTINRERMMTGGGRFAHYTSAENALKIITSKCIWMRNATCMSDYQEVQHGYGALQRYFKTNRGKFDHALNICFPGVANDALGLFDQWWQSIQLQTYITSISEHDKREDLHGRLSMWRAFGGAPGRVALVIKVPLALGENAKLGALLSPVGYFTDERVSQELDTVLNNIEANQKILSSLDREMFRNFAFMMLMTAVVSLKHEGFHEEKEWRVIHSPKLFPSAHIVSNIEVIGGIPQLVYKIPFRNDSSAGIVGLEPIELVDRVIIGPTQFPWAMFEAFVAALEAAGISDAASRVAVSRIPVRT
jgi:hypothetical protein